MGSESEKPKVDIHGAFRSQHLRWVRPIHKIIHDVEHFRRKREHGYKHIAVVVLTNGECFVGTAEPSKRDPYIRKIGYIIAVGRALKKANLSYRDFKVDPSLKGLELRDAVAKILEP